jgi:phage-related baseplate assembly protein
MPSIIDLLSAPDETTLKEKFLQLLRLAGFPVVAWQRFSLLRHTAETEPRLFADLWKAIGLIADSGFVRRAKGAWLDIAASEFFNETRKPAVATEGYATLTDTAVTGPHTINAGQFWVGNAGAARRFVVTGVGLSDASTGTLSAGGTLRVKLRAETAGADWNVGVGAITDLVTVLAGVSVSNPSLDTGTWITVQGADQENDEELAQRCIDKWSTLGAGADDGAYRYWSKSSSPEITRVNVYSPAGGSVRVVVGGATGPVSTDALAAAVALVEAKRPLGVPDVVTSNARARVTLIQGTLTPKPGKDGVAMKAAAQAAVEKLGRDTAFAELVSRERIIASLMVDTAKDLNLVSPAADFTLGLDEVFVPTFDLTVGE